MSMVSSKLKHTGKIVPVFN